MNRIAQPSPDPRKVALVTAGLGVTGALAGAGVGVAMTLVTGGFAGAPGVGSVLVPAALVGAATGALLLPVGAWILMRRVPLGRAFLGTLVPSALGAAAALAFFGLAAPVGITGAVVGFGLAALGLRRSAPAAPALPPTT